MKTGKLYCTAFQAVLPFSNFLPEGVRRVGLRQKRVRDREMENPNDVCVPCDEASGEQFSTGGEGGRRRGG